MKRTLIAILAGVTVASLAGCRDSRTAEPSSSRVAAHLQ